MAFAVAGAVYAAIAAGMVLYGFLSEGQSWASAVAYAYLTTGPALVITLGFMRARWFFNVSPSAQIDTEPSQRADRARAAADRLAAGRTRSRAKRRRRQGHPVPTTRAIRER
jgi:hypothetical protein